MQQKQKQKQKRNLKKIFNYIGEFTYAICLQNHYFMKSNCQKPNKTKQTSKNQKLFS